MTEKNRPERFEKAFEGVPAHIWRLFTNPQKDLVEHVKHVAGDAHIGKTGVLQRSFCRLEQSIKADQRTASPNTGVAQSQN